MRRQASASRVDPGGRRRSSSEDAGRAAGDAYAGPTGEAGTPVWPLFSDTKFTTRLSAKVTEAWLSKEERAAHPTLRMDQVISMKWATLVRRRVFCFMRRAAESVVAGTPISLGPAVEVTVSSIRTEMKEKLESRGIKTDWMGSVINHTEVQEREAEAVVRLNPVYRSAPISLRLRKLWRLVLFAMGGLRFEELWGSGLQMSFHTYCKVTSRLYLHFLCGISANLALQICKHMWVMDTKDAGGHPPDNDPHARDVMAMTYDMFHEVMVDVACSWCTGHSEKETVDFFKEVARVVVPKDKADHYHALRNRMAAFLSGNTRKKKDAHTGQQVEEEIEKLLAKATNFFEDVYDPYRGEARSEEATRMLGAFQRGPAGEGQRPPRPSAAQREAARSAGSRWRGSRSARQGSDGAVAAQQLDHALNHSVMPELRAAAGAMTPPQAPATPAHRITAAATAPPPHKRSLAPPQLEDTLKIQGMGFRQFSVCPSRTGSPDTSPRAVALQDLPPRLDVKPSAEVPPPKEEPPVKKPPPHRVLDEFAAYSEYSQARLHSHLVNEAVQRAAAAAPHITGTEYLLHLKQQLEGELQTMASIVQADQPTNNKERPPISLPRPDAILDATATCLVARKAAKPNPITQLYAAGSATTAARENRVRQGSVVPRDRLALEQTILLQYARTLQEDGCVSRKPGKALQSLLQLMSSGGPIPLRDQARLLRLNPL
eukprot:EG_transcript_3623